MIGALLVLGCGGHGRVVADIALERGYTRIAFLDDAPDAAERADGMEVLGPLARLAELAAEWPAAVAAVGENVTRLALYRRLREAGFETPALIHPSAVVSRRAELGPGVVVAPAAVINVGARIGHAAIVNTGAMIDHDCMIGAGSHIAPGATLSGAVSVGDRAWLGTGCAVRQGIRIGEDVVVGVGAAVVSDLAAGMIYAGVPARPLLQQTSQI